MISQRGSVYGLPQTVESIDASRPAPRTFVILPAAGYSRRMGRPKLLLPWGEYPTLLDAVLAQWCAVPVARVVLVARADDHPVLAIARRYPVALVSADPPPSQMKVSIQLGLQWIREHFETRDEDVWLLSPADMPWVPASLVEQLLQLHRQYPRQIVVPQYQGRRGHPVLFPWPLAHEVEHLAADEGVNVLARRHPVLELPVADRLIVEDVDTPQDYERLRPD